MDTCKFVMSWIGRCDKDAVDDNGYCNDHADLVCDSCGEKATHDCHETMGLVCGAPLCDDCEHELTEQGTNGRRMAHCKKTEQKYKPWYMQEGGA